MGSSDSHGIPKDALGQLIGNLGQLNDPPTGDAWSQDPGLNRTIEGEIIPRLMMLFDRQINGAVPAPQHRPESQLPADLQEFVQLVLGNDVGVVCDYVQGLRDSGESLPDIYLSLLAPAARELGEMWERDECTFTAVTLGVSRMHQVLLRFSPCFCSDRAEDVDGVHSALIVAAPGEQHTFGLLMLTEFFRREGWNVCSSAPDSATELIELVASQPFDVIGCSVGTERTLETLPGLIQRVRERSRNGNIKVIVGGRLFSEQPGLANSVGADATAGNGMDAVRLAEQLVGPTQ